MAGLDLAAERAQVRGHRVGDRLGAAASDRPPDRVAEREQDEREPGRRRALERPHRVRAHPGQERPARVRPERGRGQAGRAPHPRSREPGGEQGVAGRPGRAEHDRGEVVPALRERTHEVGVGRAVATAEARRRLLERPVQHGGAAAVERVGGLHVRLDQLEAVLVQRQRAQERRADRERVDRRADVVPVARERQLGGRRAAADRAAPARTGAPSGRRGRARSRPRGRWGPPRRRPRRATPQPPRRNGREIMRMGAAVM